MRAKTTRFRQDPRRYVRVDGDVAYVTLTQGKVAIIDAVDAELVGQYIWAYSGHGYAVATIYAPGGGRKALYLHRLILNPPDDFQVDHRDGDRINNRQNNLRACSITENHRNRTILKHLKGKPLSSKFKGVSLFRRTGKYRAQIQVYGKTLYLGYFHDPAEAARAYDAAAREHFGEFARLNFTKDVGLEVRP